MRTLERAGLQPKDRSVIRRAAEILRRQFAVERVILFGSKARGDDRAGSDIDLLILTRGQLDWRQRDAIVDVLFDLQIHEDVLLSPVIVSVQEWEQGLYQALPLRREIERDGVLV